MLTVDEMPVEVEKYLEGLITFAVESIDDRIRTFQGLVPINA